MQLTNDTSEPGSSKHNLIRRNRAVQSRSLLGEHTSPESKRNKNEEVEEYRRLRQIKTNSKSNLHQLSTAAPEKSMLLLSFVSHKTKHRMRHGNIKVECKKDKEGERK